MQQTPRTKLIATIGPATWDDKILLSMINNGMTVARINASFADEEELTRVSQQLRRLSPRVAVMLDTMGHKIRVTGFTDEIRLLKGDKLSLVADGNKGFRGSIKVTYPSLHKDVTRGTKILIDDGTIELEVSDISAEKVICDVLTPGLLKPKKTVNIPGVHLKFPALSEKDLGDIRFAVKNGFDLISASFIRNTEDVALIREAMGETETKLIAKIEDFEGVENFDSILDVVDGIMIARGDLGVELPTEKVPILQKQYIYKCRMKGKPVIVATQMMESMRNSPRPTRAEASDVANAVLDGADALMLSAETSTGKFPAESVEYMSRIAIETEKHMSPQILSGRSDASESTDILCRHTFSLAKDIALAGVIVLTRSGKTVASLSRHRLNIPIWAITPNPKLARQLQLYSGVTPICVEDIKNDRDDLMRQAVDIVYGTGRLEINDKVVVISGSSINGKNSNSILEIADVRSTLEW